MSSVLCLSFFIQFKVFCLPFCVLHFLFSVQSIVSCLMCYAFNSFYGILPVLCDAFSVQSTVFYLLFYVLHLNSFYSILSVLCGTFSERQQNSYGFQSNTTLYLFYFYL